MAVVEMAERDVVVLVGVPGISEGVSGLGSGGGRFVRVGCEACAIAVSDMMAILLWSFALCDGQQRGEGLQVTAVRATLSLANNVDEWS